MSRLMRAAATATVGGILAMLVVGLITIPFVLFLRSSILRSLYVAIALPAIGWAMSRAVERAGAVGSPSLTAVGGLGGLLAGIGLVFGHWLDDLLPPYQRAPFILVPAGTMFLGALAAAAIPLRAQSLRALLMGLALVGARIGLEPALVLDRPSYARTPPPASSAALEPPPFQWLDVDANDLRGRMPDGSFFTRSNDGGLGSTMSLDRYDPDHQRRVKITGMGADGVLPGLDGDAFLVSPNERVTRIDANGEPQWEYHPAPEVVKVLGVAADGTLFTWNTARGSKAGGTIRAIARSGDVTDVISLDDVQPDTSRVLANGRLLLHLRNAIAIVDRSGREVWRAALPSHAALLIHGTDEGDVAVATGTGDIRLLDGSTGQPRWHVQLSGRHRYDAVTAMTSAPGGTLYVAATQLWAIEHGRERWRWNGTSVTGVLRAPDGMLYTRGTTGGGVYAISPAGVLQWMWLPDGRYTNANGTWLAGDHTLYAVAGTRIAALDLTRGTRSSSQGGGR